MNLKRFLGGQSRQRLERRLYEAIVAQARQPWFYAELGVPDTVAGRFDMIVLHSFLVIDKLAGTGTEAEELSQRLFDELFRDMDRSLREMGVGDLSVGKKVRKMAEVFYGRAEAYRAAISAADADDGASLRKALARNVFDGDTPAHGLERLADYVLRARDGLAQQPVDTILAGKLKFPPTGTPDHVTS